MIIYAGGKRYELPFSMTADEYLQYCVSDDGRRAGLPCDPDDLERINCKCGGALPHESCGWNADMNAPVFTAGKGDK